MKYKLTASSAILRQSDQAVIPVDPANRDYAEYFAWLAAGNAPEPADVAATTPSSVSPRQARLALHQAGLLANVEAAIAAADDATKIEWEYATTFERASPAIAALSATLGLSASQLDSLFSLAATL